MKITNGKLKNARKGLLAVLGTAFAVSSHAGTWSVYDFVAHRSDWPFLVNLADPYTNGATTSLRLISDPNINPYPATGASINWRVDVDGGQNQILIFPPLALGEQFRRAILEYHPSIAAPTPTSTTIKILSGRKYSAGIEHDGFTDPSGPHTIGELHATIGNLPLDLVGLNIWVSYPGGENTGFFETIGSDQLDVIPSFENGKWISRITDTVSGAAVSEAKAFFYVQAPYETRLKMGFSYTKIHKITWIGTKQITSGWIRSDIDADGEVGPGDFERVVDAFGSSTYDEFADVDLDFEIGPGDFEEVVANFGNTYFTYDGTILGETDTAPRYNAQP